MTTQKKTIFYSLLREIRQEMLYLSPANTVHDLTKNYKFYLESLISDKAIILRTGFPGLVEDIDFAAIKAINAVNEHMRHEWLSSFTSTGTLALGLGLAER